MRLVHVLPGIHCNHLSADVSTQGTSESGASILTRQVCKTLGCLSNYFKDRSSICSGAKT